MTRELHVFPATRKTDGFAHTRYGQELIYDFTYSVYFAYATDKYKYTHLGPQVFTKE